MTAGARHAREIVLMSKLHEIRVFQREGEVRRRWFTRQGADLVVWQDAAGISSIAFC